MKDLKAFASFYTHFTFCAATQALQTVFMWMLILLAVIVTLTIVFIVYESIRGRHNLLWIWLCRLFQLIMRLGLKAVSWRNPVLIEGQSSAQDIAVVLKEKNIKRVLIVTGPTIYKLGMASPLQRSLDSESISYFVHNDIQQNPTIENVEAGVRLYIQNDCEALIALGGGSPIDCAKVIGARIVRPKKSVIKMAGLLKVRKKLPLLIAVPTTAGTGSEVTIAAVITDSQTHRKFAISDFSLIPDYAVLDAQLTVNMPKSLTAATGMDALTHAIEAYIGRSNTFETKQNAKNAILLIKENLLRAFDCPDDLQARKNMLTASYLAGLAFTKAYVGNVHAAAHTLSGFYGVSHGVANASLLPVVLRHYGASAHKKLAELAKIMGIAAQERTINEQADALIEYIEGLNANMGLPRTFDMISDDDLPKMIKNALKEANPLYPVPKIFSKHDFREVFLKIKG